MKRFIFYVVALCMMTTLGGCDIEEFMNSLIEEENNEMVIPPYFNDGRSYVKLSADVPATNSFTIKTNQSWVITEKPTWCELDVMEGVGETIVNVVARTSTINHRVGYVKVHCADLGQEKIVEIKQNGNTLSVITGDYKGSVVTSGVFKGIDNKRYNYEHKIKVEFTINGSHLASECGVTGNHIKGITSDGVHEATVTLLSNSEATSFAYEAFAISKATGEKLYGKKKEIISR